MEYAILSSFNILPPNTALLLLCYCERCCGYIHSSTACLQLNFYLIVSHHNLIFIRDVGGRGGGAAHHSSYISFFDVLHCCSSHC